MAALQIFTLQDMHFLSNLFVNGVHEYYTSGKTNMLAATSGNATDATSPANISTLVALLQKLNDPDDGEHSYKDEKGQEDVNAPLLRSLSCAQEWNNELFELFRHFIRCITTA
ncbi:MAG: hypothetical protein LBP35_06905 [Candidatus Ancillula trichonymphae]|nr:hypothetical protein [Candidatus Ancillula trichonymphae]